MKCRKCGYEVATGSAIYCPGCGEKLYDETAEHPAETVLYDISPVWPEWKIEKELGVGSYGVVYQAVRKDSGIESRAAIKVISIPTDKSQLDSLRSEGLTIEESRTYFKGIVKEFVEEIRLMETFKGVQNIVSVEDYKVIEKTGEIGWDIFIRMELLTPLNDYLSDNTLSEEEIINLGTDICSALEICSKSNVIHRDIKPENIFINHFGHFKLGDFGIARSLENKTSGLSTKGTPNYMAPEIIRCTAYDSRVDIYSLGITLYKLLNRNRLPFIETEKQILSHHERQAAFDRRIAGEPIPAPAGASPQLAAVVLKACAYKPEGRYATAKQFSEALKRAAKGEAENKTSPSGGPGRTPSGGLGRTPSGGPGRIPSGGPGRIPSNGPVRGSSNGPGPLNKSGSIPQTMPPITAPPSPGSAGNKNKPKKNKTDSKKEMSSSAKLVLFCAIAAVIIGVVTAVIIFFIQSIMPPSDSDTYPPVQVSTEDIQIGIICEGNSNTNYDNTFIDALTAVQQEMGMSDYQITVRENIPAGEECYTAATELAIEGCNLIIATSAHYEEYIIRAAEEYTDIHFTCIGGKKAHMLSSENYYNAYALQHEVRYITGVAAGLALNQMIYYGQIYESEAVIGFVGTYTGAEVISAYTAFYLGAKSVCPSVRMLVEFTGAKYDKAAEESAAENLISKGAVLISQYSDLGAAVFAADKKEVSTVAYNLDSRVYAPDYCVAYGAPDWETYFSYLIECIDRGDAVNKDWAVGFENKGSGVKYAVDYEMLPYGAEDQLDEAVDGIILDSVNVFDTAQFTYNGSKLRSYYADVDPDASFDGDTEVISGGSFRESFYRSAPYFDILIDEIELINEKY